MPLHEVFVSPTDKNKKAMETYSSKNPSKTASDLSNPTSAGAATQTQALVEMSLSVTVSY